MQPAPGVITHLASQNLIGNVFNMNVVMLHQHQDARLERLELQALLGIYGQMVARGVWKDYALNMVGQEARFAVFRKFGEAPQFTIVKNLKLAKRQGAWALLNQEGLVLKRAHEFHVIAKHFHHQGERLDKRRRA